MKKQKVGFLLLKIYLPILLIASVSVLTPYLLTTQINSLLEFIDIPFVNDGEGLLQVIIESIFLRIIFSILIFGLILVRYRKRNSSVLFNRGNVYLDIDIFYFHFALAKILGYKSISLVRMALALQYKVILKDTFETIFADKHHKEELEITAVIQNEDCVSDEVNLVLSDTYKVGVNQLPINKLGLTTVCIDSKAETGNRIYNPLFVKEIQNQTHYLSDRYKRVNIYSHTNTHHNKEIIESCFNKGGRGEFQEVYVYQYSPQFKKFNAMGVKVN